MGLTRETKEEGPDLFPSSFIVNLAAPSSYVGPSKIFGAVQDDGSRNALPLTVAVSDYLDPESEEGWMPPKHKSDHMPLWKGQDTVPPSVKRAIHSFILSCAARACRGQGSKHSSMLLHVTKFTAVQDRVCKQVGAYVNGIRQRIERNIDASTILEELRTMWETDFVPTSAELASVDADEFSPPPSDWSEISAALVSVCGDISVRKINGTAKDVETVA